MLPAAYLNGMHPWAAEHSSDAQPQWNPLLWDGIAQFYPWRVHYARALSQDNKIPLWNPYQFCGTPFVANAQTAVFYPLNLLFLLFNPARAFGLSALLHLFLAGIFTFLFARALGIGRFGATLAGTTFAFSAFMVLWLELPTLVDVATWLPLVLYLILRAWDRTGPLHAVFAGLALGAAILAGHLQIASYLVLAAALWWGWLAVSRIRVDGWISLARGLMLGAICFAVAFLIAAPQIIPTVELAGLSHRTRQVTSAGYSSYVGGAVPIRHLVTLFIPNWLGNPSSPAGYLARSPADYMEFGMYVGILPLLLAVFGSIFAIRWRAVGFFVVLGLLAFLLAVGTPLNLFFYYLVPGTSSLGGPGRTIVLFCFAAAMLAGFGGHWFFQLAHEEYRATHRRLGWRALAVGGAAFAAIFVAFQWMSSAGINAMGLDAGKVASVAIGQYISFAAMLIASVALLALYTAGHVPKPLFATLAVVIIAADLFSFGMNFNPVSSLSEVYPSTQLTRSLTDQAPDTRLMPVNKTWSLYRNPGAILPPNAATVYGFFDMQGYDSLFSRTYKEFVDQHLNMDSAPPENGNMLLIRNYVSDWPQGTAGYVLSMDAIDSPDLKQAFEADGLRVYERTGAGGYQQAYQVSDLTSTAPITDAGVRSWIAGRDVNTVTLVATATTPAQLVLAESYYPGWKAYSDTDSDQMPVAVYQGVFRSAAVEPGTQSVTFRFEPGSYVVGLFLGLLGLTVVTFTTGVYVVRRLR